MAGNEDNDEPSDSSRSFWVTAPGLITAIGGLLTAIAVLIGALSAAGVIGGKSDASSPSTDASLTPTDRPDSDGVLHGDWLVNVTVRTVNGPGSFYGNQLWGLEPMKGASQQEHWTLKSCPESPCEARWESIEMPDRFATLAFANGTYKGNDTGIAGCPGGSVPVQRGILLNVTDAADLAGVWSATKISGHIETSWTCGGVPVGGVLDVDGTRVLP